MDILNNIKTYMNENEFKIIILNNKLNILNYDDIGHFDSNRIIIKHEEKQVVINGNNLVVSKLVGDEILVTGELYNIEFR